MWRFLLPALAMTTALIVLFAGALGDLHSLPDLSDRIVAFIGGVEPRQAPPPTPASAPSAAAIAQQQSAREALQRQVADLGQQVNGLQDKVAQRSRDLDAARADEARMRQDLDTARAETDKLRQDIDTLHQQRQADAATLARQKAQEQQAATAAPPRPPLPRPAAAPTQPVSPPTQPVSPPPQPMPMPSAAQQWLTARQWLAAGRPDEARRVLATVQTQMVLQPVTPDAPEAQGRSPAATEVGVAIRWLDIGATGQAMQAIDRAIGNANRTEAPSRPWSPYPAGPPPGYPTAGLQRY